MGNSFVARGRVMKAGRKQVFTNAELYAEQDGARAAARGRRQRDPGAGECLWSSHRELPLEAIESVSAQVRLQSWSGIAAITPLRELLQDAQRPDPVKLQVLEDTDRRKARYQECQ